MKQVFIFPAALLPGPIGQEAGRDQDPASQDALAGSQESQEVTEDLGAKDDNSKNGQNQSVRI
jgi:hypothetical protein